MEQQQKTKASSISAAYKKIVSVFIIIAIVLVSTILYFSLAKAKIYLKVNSQPAKIDFTTQVKENVEDNNYLETNILPGRILELVIEKTKEFKVVKKEKASDKYGGIMTVTNNQGISQPLVKNTQFQSENGKIFRTQEAIVIPANGKIDVYVLADGTGDDYKAEPGKFVIIKLKSETQKFVYGETKEEMAQKAFTTNELTDSDIKEASVELTEDLKADAAFKLKALLLKDENLPDSAIITDIIAEESNKNVGEVVDSFEYTIKLKVVGVVFNQDELLTLAQTFLNNQLDKTQKLLNYDNSSFSYKIANYNEDEKNVSLEVQLSANVVQDSSAEIFDKNKFKGLNQEEIIDYFKTIPGIESVRVQFSPFWVKKAPKMSNHIELIFD
ncbi:MAG: hypothetical protein PHZ07_03290 [Patescibacteria group bacterium]|nr:hypothetical protein [Patescibacteria group bacterium]MDD4304356.1 hypothetical protein [Patescibacteria group bacterium]MDD4695379.1 hypothetical protein [Patescibacteria group bacterium]